jgi:hypothetical protein
VETLILIGQALIAAGPGGFIALGLLENLRHPRINRGMVGQTLRMDKVREERPEAYAIVKGNRSDSVRLEALAWGAILAAEAVAALALCLGAVWLGLAAFGLAGAEAGRVVAGAGALVFVAIWTGFLVGGQWFHYWAGWKELQFTHFFLTLWGLLSFLALVAL